jgi:hypothetical protein
MVTKLCYSVIPAGPNLFIGCFQIRSCEVRENIRQHKKQARRGRMAKQPRVKAEDGYDYGIIGQQTDREGWIAGW